MLFYHPAIAVLLATVPFATIWILFANMFDPGENFEVYQNQIIITESALAFGETKSESTVAIVGTIKNTSRISWKDIYFHADFFDAQGHRKDAGEKQDYSFRLPAGGISSFKISFRREFPESNYVKHEVRVVAAKDARARW
jgi:hypothetical protein